MPGGLIVSPDAVGPVMSRAASSASSQVQILEELRSFECRTVAPKRQTEVQRHTILSPTCGSASRTSLPGNDHIAEARRLVELGCVSGGPANVNRSPTATCVRAVPLAKHGSGRRAAGTGWQLEPPDVARAQTRAELSTDQKGFAARGHLRPPTLRSTTLSSQTCRDSVAFEVQTGHHTGGLDMFARIVRSKETHSEAIIRSHVKRVKSEM